MRSHCQNGYQPDEELEAANDAKAQLTRAGQWGYGKNKYYFHSQ